MRITTSPEIRITASASTAAPPISTRQSTLSPGSGSARRASPIGKIGDRSAATTVPSTAPLAITAVMGAKVAARCDRVAPSVDRAF